MIYVTNHAEQKDIQMEQIIELVEKNGTNHINHERIQTQNKS